MYPFPIFTPKSLLQHTHKHTFPGKKELVQSCLRNEAQVCPENPLPPSPRSCQPFWVQLPDLAEIWVALSFSCLQEQFLQPGASEAATIEAQNRGPHSARIGRGSLRPFGARGDVCRPATSPPSAIQRRHCQGALRRAS